MAPFAIGRSGVSPGRYLLLNCIGAGIWAVAIGTLGYIFGHALEIVLEDVKRYEMTALAVIAVLGGCAWAVYGWRQRLRRGIDERPD